MPAPGLPVTATGKTPCTVWPRTVMRGNPRKVNSGRPCVPKSARRTEPSSRFSRFAAHLRCVSAKEGKGSQEGIGNHTWCPVPFCPCRGHGIPRPPKAAPPHALRGRKLASSGAPLYRRKVYPLLRVRRRGRRGLPDRHFLTLKKIFGIFSKKRLTLSLAYANLYTG